MKAPRILAISDRAALGGDWEAWCAAMAEAGVDALQIREKSASDRELLALARAARRRFPRPGLLLVNGRADVALAAAADGIHLPARGLPPAAVRAIAGPVLLIGASTHELREVEAAVAEGFADYVLFGPLHATPSKAGRIEPRGISSLAGAARCGAPVLAVGGIDDAARAAAAIAAGAHGVAGIRAFLDPERTREIVAAVRAATSST
ncbi:MAG: putative thiamine-phosphate synthase 2 [Acidobacteriota bacterium]